MYNYMVPQFYKMCTVPGNQTKPQEYKLRILSSKNFKLVKVLQYFTQFTKL